MRRRFLGFLYDDCNRIINLTIFCLRFSLSALLLLAGADISRAPFNFCHTTARGLPSWRHIIRRHFLPITPQDFREDNGFDEVDDDDRNLISCNAVQWFHANHGFRLRCTIEGHFWNAVIFTTNIRILHATMKITNYRNTAALSLFAQKTKLVTIRGKLLPLSRAPDCLFSMSYLPECHANTKLL